MSRKTDRYPAMNPPGLEPERKQPDIPSPPTPLPPGEGGRRPGEGKGEGAPTPEPSAAREEQEELSVEKLEAELFDREVPEEYRKFFGTPFIELPDAYSARLRNIIFDFSGAGDPSYPIPEDFEAIPIAAIPDGVLSDFGSFLKLKVQGHTVIDLGSGETSYMEKYAVALGANRYIGVDDQMRKEGGRREQQTEVYHINSGMLSFVARMREGVGVIYYLSGIEPNWSKMVAAEEYSRYLLKEMKRTMRPGDIIILGEGTRGFKPTEYGFKQLAFESLAEFHRDLPEVYTTRVYILE